jgi:4-hydroxy-tetrahydrodipicolinate synthase
MSGKLTGTGVALVTPFTKELKVDYDALEKLLEHTANGGVDYYVIHGTTGEAATTSAKEKSSVLIQKIFPWYMDLEVTIPPILLKN